MRPPHHTAGYLTFCLGLKLDLKHCPARRISIDGHTEISFTEDVAARFVALGWHVQHVKDGNTDLAGLRSALDAAKKDPRPSFIKARPAGITMDPRR